MDTTCRVCDVSQAEHHARGLLSLVGVDRAINLIREEAGQGGCSPLYDMARDPDIYDLVAEVEMPDTAREIVRLIGLPCAIDLFRALGGVSFPAPQGEKNNRQGALRFEMLAECVGVNAAKVLCQEFGGTVFYIPKCQQAQQNIRDRRILRDFDKGASIEELALKYRITDRRIKGILKKPL
jgi:Mor family transcriptional regulator